MSMTVVLPALGESVVEGTIAKWLVKEGDTVEVDQPLLEITTDKVDAEIPSPESGRIEKILVSEGDTVPVGGELVVIDTDASASAPPFDVEPRFPAAPFETTTAASSVPDSVLNSALGGGSVEAAVVRATPVARRMAEAAGADLGSIRGTGPSGRVTKEDVSRFTQGRASKAVPPVTHVAEAPSAPRPAPSSDSNPPRSLAPPAARRATRPGYMDYQLQPGDKVIPMTPLRKLVADHMVYSKATSPHVGTVAEIDMGAVSEVRDAHRRTFRETNGFSLSFLPFIVHATVRALREHPRLNASVLEDAIVEKRDLHIGIAVETEKGLVVPVVRYADRLSLAGLAQAVEDLAHRARSKRLSADELKGGTFTLSNPGRKGKLHGFAIINQPQVGILRIGEIVKRPVVRSVGRDDAIVVRPMMHLALSYDHRAIDGAPANGFLYRIRELLEEGEFDL